MSRVIYLVVLRCTGRTCNAHLVIGGDVVASSWYVFFVIICMFSYIVFVIVLFGHSLLEIKTPKRCCLCFCLPRGSCLSTSLGMGREAEDHFGII